MDFLKNTLRNKFSLAIFKRCLTGIVCLYLLASPATISANTFDPEQIRAVFIYNLVNFVTFPKANDAGEPFIIAVMGNRAIAHHIAILTKGEKLNGRPFLVKFITNENEIYNCDLLYVAQDCEISLKDSLCHLVKHGILSVGETLSFIESGGMVALLPNNKRIQIAINLEVSKLADINFSSKLLKIARLIRVMNCLEGLQQ